MNFHFAHYRFHLAKCIIKHRGRTLNRERKWLPWKILYCTPYHPPPVHEFRNFLYLRHGVSSFTWPSLCLLVIAEPIAYLQSTFIWAINNSITNYRTMCSLELDTSSVFISESTTRQFDHSRIYITEL